MKPRPLFLSPLLILGLFQLQAVGEEIRVFPQRELPPDSRYDPPITLNDYHPFRPVGSKAEWNARREHIKLRILVGSGLWPLPTKTPLNPTVHGELNMGDYTVKKVFFESFPGHYVTGNLYEPSGLSLQNGLKNGLRPAVLSPHGHWKDARFLETDEQAAKNLIAIGAERYLTAARNHIQARCVQLARMGCVVFHYDMLGNSDSMQFQEHRRGPREHLAGRELGQWGLVSPRAAGWLQTNFGIQTWNSVRSLDFIANLPGVDPDRLLITGASGGGTQTQMLAAIDDRIDASFPCVMPSTAMQGGCTCENTYFLRIGQGNMDIAGAVAPRPQGMTAADDWTRELETKGAPDLFDLYKMFGAKGRFEAHYDIHFKHNYNHVSRTHMYNFVNQHFRLGFSRPVLERDFKLLKKEHLTVWSADYPQPGPQQSGDVHEKELLKWWATDASQQLQTRKDAPEVLQSAVSILINRDLPEAKDLDFQLKSKAERDDHLVMSGILKNTRFNESIPALFLHPKDWNGHTVIWANQNGKRDLYSNGSLNKDAKRLIDGGMSIMAPDLWMQGEFLSGDQTTIENPRTQYPGDATKPGASWRLSSVYYYGYNDSLFSKRVHDLLSCVAFVRSSPNWDVKKVSLIGLEGAGHWVAAARAVAGKAIDQAVIKTGGFRFADLESDWDADFLPGALKYGDLPTFIFLGAPNRLWLDDPDDGVIRQLKEAYKTHPKSLSTEEPDFVSFLSS